jgi:hypothetical protein
VKKKIPDDCMPMCRTCSFYAGDKKEEFGECRRFPPQIIPDEDGVGFSFAITAEDQWCGEYRRATN